MTLRALGLLSLLSLACASAPAATPTAMEPAAVSTAALEAPVETPEPCQVVFSPAPELLEETTAVAARWATATGCDIRVGEGGIAVRIATDLGLSPLGTKAHGWTHCPVDGETCKRSALLIDLTADHKASALAHEFGHALGSSAAHLPDDEAPALMTHWGGDGLITAADLVYVCAALDCQLLAPETPQG